MLRCHKYCNWYHHASYDVNTHIYIYVQRCHAGPEAFVLKLGSTDLALTL